MAENKTTQTRRTEMNPIQIIKSVISIAILLAIAWLAWDYVHCKQELAVLQNVIEMGDAQAKEQQIEQERNYETVKSESDKRRADADLYKRMLLAANKAQVSGNANLPAILGGAITSADANGVGCSIEYRTQCLEVINRVVTCRDLILLNKFPLK